jgi:DNA gyrase subunit A
VLTEAGAAVKAVVPLEVTDDPCLVVLSGAGLLSRLPRQAQDAAGGELASSVRPESSASPAVTGPADLVTSSVATTARGVIGAVTTAGRMIRVSVIEIPPASTGTASAGTGPAGPLAAGHPVDEFVPGLAEGETVLALAPLDGGESSGIALGTASGVVKRVQPDYPANRDEFELITLKEDDRVIGAAYLSGDDADLVFVTSDAQLLRFAASVVRPQGRPAGGMAGIRLDGGATVLWFGAVGPAARVPGVGDPAADPAAEAVVVTVAGHSDALPGTGGASVKVTPFAEYPAKGRATGGVRCQRFLKNEDALTQAWIGPPPVSGITESGIVVDLTGMTGRRDGSGNAVTRPLSRLGTPFSTP